MYQPSPQQKSLFSEAETYQYLGDVYHAVKLFKLLVKKAPEWILPHLHLARIFKDRKEWKAVMHYNKKALALEPGLQEAWWDLGIASLACGKKRQARRTWNKFGWTDKKLEPLLSVQIAHSGLFELIWVKPLSPASGLITSIPHPQSQHAYRDLILFDREVIGHNVSGKRKLPVYEELDILKHSHFNTFSGLIDNPGKEDLDLMDRLAKEAGMGFEIWSNAARSKKLQPSDKKPEYYSGKALFGANSGHSVVLIALAGRRPQQVRQLIKSWEVITLKTVQELEQHG